MGILFIDLYKKKKYSQLFQRCQAIEGAISQQGDLVVTQVPVLGQMTKKQHEVRIQSK